MAMHRDTIKPRGHHVASIDTVSRDMGPNGEPREVYDAVRTF